MTNGRDRYNGEMLAVESIWPSKRAWLLGSRYARRAPSPFLSLKEFPGWEAVAELLIEEGEIEVEFDVIGREMWIVSPEIWDDYKGLWFQALAAAVAARPAPAAEPPC